MVEWDLTPAMKPRSLQKNPQTNQQTKNQIERKKNRDLL